MLRVQITLAGEDRLYATPHSNVELLLERCALALGARDQLVEIVNVLLVMLAVVIRDGFGRDHRLECVVGIWQRR